MHRTNRFYLEQCKSDKLSNFNRIIYFDINPYYIYYIHYISKAKSFKITIT